MVEITYDFKNSHIKFKEGGVDEKIAFDRYSTPLHDFSKMEVGDIVVAKIDRNKDIRKVGVLKEKLDNKGVVEIREFNYDSNELSKSIGTYDADLITKPLDLKPVDFWRRWALAGATMEKKEKQAYFANKFAEHLFDGYKYSLGGRIQLMAGQEFTLLGEKANLTAYNCYVGASPDISQEDYLQSASDINSAIRVFYAIIDNMIKQAEIMARGGGYGVNYSTVPHDIIKPESEPSVALYLPDTHPDIDILINMVKDGRFKNVDIITNQQDLSKYKLNILIEDSREALVDGLKHIVRSAYNGESIAIDFSNIRKKGALVKGVNGRSSGAPSWMLLYNLMAGILKGDTIDAVETMELPSEETGLIEQGGSRRGALMMMLNVDHPNILKFISRKREMGKLTYANISVAITDAFMDKVKNGDKEANSIWNVLVESAWSSGEPGVVFIDTYNKKSNSWYYGTIIATNPCKQYCMAS